MATTYKKDAIYEKLRQAILSGDYHPGQQLPKELDFARELGVAFNTLRSALARLQEEHLVVRLRGQGTFVAEKPYAPRLLVLYVTGDDRTHPWHYILPHLIEIATQHGVEIENFDYYAFRRFKKAQVKRFIESRHIQGVVFLGNAFNGTETIIPLLKSAKVPVVIAPAYAADGKLTGFASVIMDVPQAWKLGLSHLRDRGFHRVLTEVYEGIDGTIRRYSKAAYFALLQELGLDTDPNLILETPRHNHEVLRKKLFEIFKNRATMPHAVMCFTDFTAHELYQVLDELHLRIPEDVAVMGFCGALAGDVLEPGLSTIDLEFQTMAQQAFEVISSASEWFDPQHPEKAAPQIVAPYKLHCSGSTDVVRREAAQAQTVAI